MDREDVKMMKNLLIFYEKNPALMYVRRETEKERSEGGVKPYDLTVLQSTQQNTVFVSCVSFKIAYLL